MIENLKIKRTLPYLYIQLGFYLICNLLTLLLDAEMGEAVRVLILEWGAFPMLCAITGGVMAEKEGFLPLYGIASAILFIPFLFLFYSEFNVYIILMYAIMGYAGTFIGYILYRKEVSRIEKGLPEKPRKRSFLFKLMDRHNIDQYK